MDERSLPGSCGHTGPWHVTAAIYVPGVTCAQIVACDCGRTYRVDGVVVPWGPPPPWAPERGPL